MELIYGWGNDILTGMIAKEHNLKVGVTDRVCITHLNSQTINKGVTDLEGNLLTNSEYCRRAEGGMMEYMQKTKRWDMFQQFRYNAATYSYRT